MGACVEWSSGVIEEERELTDLSFCSAGPDKSGDGGGASLAGGGGASFAGGGCDGPFRWGGRSPH